MQVQASTASRSRAFNVVIVLFLLVFFGGMVAYSATNGTQTTWWWMLLAGIGLLGAVVAGAAAGPSE